MEILRIENLSFSYPECTQKAVDDISLSVKQGDFVIIAGESGCGKTTLLRLIKASKSLHGEKSGCVYLKGKAVNELSERENAADIGYVMQSPENQIVTDKVWHELAFGLESLGVKSDEIRRRVGEAASYFGIHEWFSSKTDELSGGQKQLLNLASVLLMRPKILMLDEPTSRLDPIAAQNFISVLKKLNLETGLTVIMAEHRLEYTLEFADKLLLMDKGRLLLYDSPEKVCESLALKPESLRLFRAFPSAVRLYSELKAGGKCPISVRDGRNYLLSHFGSDIKEYEAPKLHLSEQTVLEIKDVHFRYGKNSPDVLKGVSLTVQKGELFCVLGGNGTGKTTMLNCISGLDKPYSGSVKILGKKIKDYKGNSLYSGVLSYLPQDPKTVFVGETVEKDFDMLLEATSVSADERNERIKRSLSLFGLEKLAGRHPFDLSGGEQQKCAIAKLMLLSPEILLMDEPTKGLDAFAKQALALEIKKLTSSGISVLAVTHDIEFAAEYSTRCALFFDGEILSVDAPSPFFADNSFYTTAACLIAGDMYHGAVTVDAVKQMCVKNGEKNDSTPE